MTVLPEDGAFQHHVVDVTTTCTTSSATATAAAAAVASVIGTASNRTTGIDPMTGRNRNSMVHSTKGHVETEPKAPLVATPKAEKHQKAETKTQADTKADATPSASVLNSRARRVRHTRTN